MQQSPSRGEVKTEALGKRYKRFRRKRVRVEPGYELVFHGHRGGLVEKVYNNGDVGFLDREGKETATVWAG